MTSNGAEGAWNRYHSLALRDYRPCQGLCEVFLDHADHYGVGDLAASMIQVLEDHLRTEEL